MKAAHKDTGQFVRQQLEQEKKRKQAEVEDLIRLPENFLTAEQYYQKKAEMKKEFQQKKKEVENDLKTNYDSKVNDKVGSQNLIPT
jgi:molecular chaperone DnaK (HSP70)